ncbi:MAG: methionine ABC transporter substrate-binding protein [Synergistaceae bacterium]|jgi:D-methionine transport system substrate-binding protein|nr:methionine ABC transporter substrate-binding protein [Synergistaceae bacterium]
MKIRGRILGAAMALVLVLSAASYAADGKKIVVGVSPVPHAGIMKVAGALLEKEGYTVEIQEFFDYVLPNIALGDGSLDANFVQHVPYLNDQILAMNYAFTWLARVHVERMGLYSRNAVSVAQLPHGAVVALPAAPSDWTRALRLLDEAGLIKVRNRPHLALTDITENPRNLMIVALNAQQLPSTLRETAAAVINANVAIQAGMNPLRNALFLEEASSSYANVLVVRKADADRPALRALAGALNSPEVRSYIETQLSSLGIVPAF